MKHMKRFLAILLAMVLLCTCTPFAFAEVVTIVDSGYCGAEGDGKNISWQCDSEGTLTISGTGQMQNYNKFFRSDIMEPPWWDYLVEVDESNYYIKRIIVEEGVENIGDFSFYGSTATSVSLPSTLKEIGIGAFLMNEWVTSITVPASVKWIGVMAFGLFGAVGIYGEDEDDSYNVQPIITVLSTDCVYQNTVRHIDPSTDEWITEELGYATLCLPIYAENDWTFETIIGDGLLINGFAGSTTEAYAEKYGRRFVPLDTSVKSLFEDQSRISLQYRSFAFDPDVSLSVVQLDEVPETSFLNPFSKKTAWDISALLHGEKVQPLEPVTVSIPVPDGYQESGISVYHFDSQGQAEKIEPITVENGTISFSTSTFSVFVVAGKSAQPQTDTPDEPDTNTNGCPWCGKTHTGFFQQIVAFFHRIFARLFGARH